MARAAGVSVDPWRRVLDEVTGVVGVRGALIVSTDDGLVVAESAMASLETADVAALAAGLAQRAARVTSAAGGSAPTSVRLTAERGSVIAVAGVSPLWLVAIVDPSAELGRLRILLGDLAATVG